MNRKQLLIDLAYLRLLVAITKGTLLVIALFLVTKVNAQTFQNGTISRPDILGNQRIHFNNGLSGTLSGPDILGARTLHYNNGAVIRYSGSDILGNSRITIISKPGE